MGVKDVLSRKSGVIVGDDVLKLFNYAQEHNFAIPAVVSDLAPLEPSISNS
jgi:fructose-bisphosphate aldolase class II